MKKLILHVLLTFISVFAFTLGANAALAPNTISIGNLGAKLEDYVSGAGTVWDKYDKNGTKLYCEVANLKYPANLNVNLNEEVNKGFVYILQKMPNVSSNQKYYIGQVAVWWYRDILNGNTGNGNLTKTFKDYCTNNRSSNSTCGYIYNLVEGAKNYKEATGSISFSTGNVTFTQSGNYFISNTINITSQNLSSWDGLSFSNAPTGTEFVYSTVSGGNGAFQIKVPVASVGAGKSITFTIEANGKYNSYHAYDYYYSSGYQKVIYDKVYTVPHTTYASKTATLSRAGTTTTTTTRTVKHNSLTVYKVDENGYKVKDAILTLYKGNCEYSTCYSSNEYRSWITNTSQNPYRMEDLPVGYYTLVETSTPNGYETAKKALINIARDDRDYEHTMVNKYIEEYNSLTIYKKDQNNQNVTGAGLTLYKGNCVSSSCSNYSSYSSWTTSSSPKVLRDLPVGYYTLEEVYTPAGYQTAEKALIYIDRNNYNYEHVLINNKIINTDVKISKTDITGANEVAGATLVIKDSSNRIIETWVSTNSPKTINLAPGDYTLTETLAPTGYKINKTIIYFRVDSSNNVSVRNDNGNYVPTDHIKMVNSLNDSVSISKLDSKTNEFINGAKLAIKDVNGNIIASWVTASGPHNVTLEPGTYSLHELETPYGYKNTGNVVYFKLLEDGNLQVRNQYGVYENAEGIIIYNIPDEPTQIVEVPKTGLSSTLSYVVGTLVLAGGAWVLLKNGVRA